jgi:hypothetical protein
MSALSALHKRYPEEEGYWEKMHSLYTQTPTTVSNMTFSVKPVEEVEKGTMVIYPMPNVVPESVPSADVIEETLMLWCKVVGKSVKSGGTDIAVQIHSGREFAPESLPETPGRFRCRAANPRIPRAPYQKKKNYR